MASIIHVKGKKLSSEWKTFVDGRSIVLVNIHTRWSVYKSKILSDLIPNSNKEPETYKAIFRCVQAKALCITKLQNSGKQFMAENKNDFTHKSLKTQGYFEETS